MSSKALFALLLLIVASFSLKVFTSLLILQAQSKRKKD